MGYGNDGKSFSAEERAETKASVILGMASVICLKVGR